MVFSILIVALCADRFRESAEEVYVAELTGGDMPGNDVTECSICFERKSALLAHLNHKLTLFEQLSWEIVVLR
jgi:hypothetical protein